jgi:hypothetical protein
MEIKITTLSENPANYGFLAGWGLRIQVDTGLSVSAVQNARKLRVSHCTGYSASAWLFEAFGDVFRPHNAGTRFILP